MRRLLLRSIAPLAVGIGLGIGVGGGAGCGGPPQSMECARFVACVRALDSAAGRNTNLARFEPDGKCWGGEKEGAVLCTTACTNGLPRLRRDVPAASVPEACR